MSARIAAAVPPFSSVVQDRLDRIMPPGRQPLVLFTTLATDERLLKRFIASALLDRGNLSLRQREIIIDRTTALCRSEYEWGVHITIFGEKAGLTEDQIESLVRGGHEDSCWGADDALLIRLCDELHRTATLSDKLWEELRMEHAEAALIEMLMLAGSYHTVSYITNGLRLPLEPDGRRFS